MRRSYNDVYYKQNERKRACDEVTAPVLKDYVHMLFDTLSYYVESREEQISEIGWRGGEKLKIQKRVEKFRSKIHQKIATTTTTIYKLSPMLSPMFHRFTMQRVNTHPTI